MPPDSTLAEDVLAGNPRAVARAMSLVEDDAPPGVDLLRAIFAKTGRAQLIGVTGPPGAGKNTLAEVLRTAEPEEWRPPIVKSVATTGKGIPELRAAIARSSIRRLRMACWWS